VTPPALPASPFGARTGMAEDVRRALLARRVVLLHGDLDNAAVAEAAATILMLDASGDERIVLRLTGGSASIDAALVLMDVIDVAGVPVDTVGAGTVAGGAVGVLAAGRHRSLAPHARLRLLEPDASVAGRATDIERTLAAQSSQRDRFLARLSGCTGRPLAHVEQEWGGGAYLEPGDALALGYADEVEGGAPRGPRRSPP
jgi:ATP-dependent protease ClpP protease subunit